MVSTLAFLVFLDKEVYPKQIQYDSVLLCLIWFDH